MLVNKVGNYVRSEVAAKKKCNEVSNRADPKANCAERSQEDGHQESEEQQETESTQNEQV